MAPRPNTSKTYKVPRRPYEAARLNHELEICGKYGLKSKREIYRINFTLGKIRKTARELLKLEEGDSRRNFEGNALIRRLIRLGVLPKEKNKLDHCLSLKAEDFLERRLQTVLVRLGLARSVHHARTLIRQRHIVVGGQVVDIPSFTVRLDSARHIDFSSTSPYGGGRPGRVARKMAKSRQGREEDE